jgi:hypothetical protein
MEITTSLFSVLSREKKQSIRLLDARLRNWEPRIHREARIANAMLQKRRRDPHDRMISGSVIAELSYWPRSAETKTFPEPIVRKRYNCTVIDDDDPFWKQCRKIYSTSAKITGYYLGPMPCCFLLYDLCLSITALEGGFDSDVLLKIAEVQCDLMTQIRIVEEIPELG